jgi:hypothetical protein
MAGEHLDGIFSGCSAPTPDLVRLWLQVARTAVGWSVANAAHEADVAIEDIARLEATGEAMDEDDDEIMCALASVYEKAMETRTESRGTAYTLSHLASAFRGDANFPLARFIRRRRAELGLTIEQVVERSNGGITTEKLHAGEWDGTRSLYDYEDDLRAIAKGLAVPYFALRLLAEYVDEADVDEWVAWRAEQRTPKRKARRTA